MVISIYVKVKSFLYPFQFCHVSSLFVMSISIFVMTVSIFDMSVSIFVMIISLFVMTVSIFVHLHVFFHRHRFKF